MVIIKFWDVSSHLQKAVNVKVWFGLTQRDSCRNSPPVDPEGDPGENHHQHGWEVRLQHEEEDVPPKDEINEQSIVPT